VAEVFRTPDERFERLPGFGFGDPVVCFHGEPTWAYLYRRMVPALTGAGRRVVCPDYPGFGRSDKPTDRRWYSYDRHVEHVSALLGALGRG
jgi:haloalkane dehalogenase